METTNYVDEMISLTDMDTRTQAEDDAFDAMIADRLATMEAQRRAAVKAQTKNHPWRRIP